MRLFKLLATLVLLCLIAIFVYENWQIWVHPIPFKLNLYFNAGRDSADIKVYLVILISALVGFILGLTALLKPFFRTRRQLKRERIEKKQAIERLASSQAQAAVEPPVQPPETSVKTD